MIRTTNIMGLPSYMLYAEQVIRRSLLRPTWRVVTAIAENAREVSSLQ